MKRKTVLLVLLMAMFAPLAMHAQGLMKAPGVSLQAVPSQELKTQITQPAREAGWLQYDNDTPYNLIGNSTAMEWTWGVMYPSSMLGTNNTLTKVAFYEYTNNIQDITINIYSGGDNAPGTLLYTEVVTPSGVYNLHEVTLAHEVTIDPTQNLWITLTETGTFIMMYCLPTTVEPNNQWIYDSEEGWGIIGEWASSFASIGWMIRGYVDYIDSDCPKPTSFTASVTPHTAILSWHSSDEIRSWEIVYSNREGFDPDQATPIPVSENPYTLTGLEEGTTYYAYVRSACGSDWSNLLSFTTPLECDAPFNVEIADVTRTSANISWEGWQNSYSLRYKPVVFYEDFEGLSDNALPAGWTSIDNDGDDNNWYSLTGYANMAHTGNGLVTSASYAGSLALTPDNWLITPQIDLQGVMSVWMRAQDPNYAAEHYAIYLSTTGNTVDDFTVTLVPEAYDLTGEYVEITADLSAYAGQQGYIAIRHFNCSDEFRLNVDDFLIEATNATWTTVDNVTSPYTLVNLSEDTQYLLQVRGNCTSGSTDWSDIASFTTLVPCMAPTNLVYNYNGGTTVDLRWESDASSFDLEVNGTPIENIGTNRYTLENLDYATVYTVRVRANCGLDGYSNWSYPISFVTDLCNAEDMCEITFVLTDGYGDGWNGAKIKVVDAGTGVVIGQITNVTNDHANAPITETYTLPVCDGRELQFVWVSGEYDDECSYTITSALGNVIFEGEGEGFETFTYTANCSWDLCDAPEALAADPTFNSADLSWEGAAQTYNIRYKCADINVNSFNQVGDDETATEEYVEYTYDLRSYAGQYGHVAIRHYNVSDEYVLLVDDINLNGNVIDFDDGVMPEGWTLVDHDGDGFNWEVYHLVFNDGEGNITNAAYSGEYGLWSASYDNDTQKELYPDNWVISPYMALGGTLTFYAKGLDADYAEEVFGVFVTTEEIGGWTVVENVSGNSYELTDLASETNYEFQVQVADADCTDPAWSFSNWFTTLTPNNFVSDGYWNDADNWFTGILPEEGDDVVISANAIIPDGYTAIAGNVTIDEEGSLTIEDGGQLIHTNTGVVATVQKIIEGYTDENDHYYLLSTPVNDEYYYGNYNLIFPEDVDTLLNENGYDLYSFDFPEELQWINQKASDYFYMWKGDGYLYANSDDVTLEFTGVLNPIPEEGYVGFIQGAYLNYADTTCMFANWNLVGNPYPCNAYIFTCDYSTSLTIVSEDFYRMNETGDEIIISSGVVAPMEGVFVVAEASTNIAVGQSTLESKGSFLSLNLSKDDHLIDAARIRFGEGKAVEKLQFDPKHSKVYFTVDDNDYAVLYAKNEATMPINFKAEKSGKYSLNFTAEAVSFSYLHLIDKLTGTEVDLLANPEYKFNAKAGENASRFVIVYEVK